MPDSPASPDPTRRDWTIPMETLETLETERLLLRQFREDDLDAYAEMVGDPEVMRHLGSGPMNRAEAWRNMAMVLGHWRLRGFGMWAVEEKATGKMVGRVGCWRPEGWPGLEVGWALRRETWGNGYATEAARASLDAAFERIGERHVISMIHGDNQASIRVAKRLGMRLEGRAELFGIPVSVYGVRRMARPSADDVRGG
jgi:RimJ/RimL family protein N-acetyltransferase